MKTFFKISIISICIILFTGCSKNDVVLTPGEQAIKNLTGDGNRYWRLSKIFDNNVPQTLTSDQLKYTKTYTINPANRFTGTFTNRDNYKGTWYMDSNATLLTEIIDNNQAGPVKIDYIIVEVTESKLDIFYVSNMRKIEEVYYAF